MPRENSPHPGVPTLDAGDKKFNSRLVAPIVETEYHFSWRGRQENALARKGSAQNGRDRLKEAMAMLIQNQAAFVGRISESERRHSEFERETTERFAHRS